MYKYTQMYICDLKMKKKKTQTANAWALFESQVSIYKAWKITS